MGQFTKLGPFSTFQLFKLSKFCSHFSWVFENTNYFFDISSNPPPIAVQNSLTNQFYQKKIKFLYIFNNKKVTCFPRLFSTFQFCIFLLLKIYRNANFSGKIDGSMNSGRWWAGDARDIKKNVFIFKTQQKMITKFGQFKKLKCREGSKLGKVSQLCYNFLSSFKNIIGFFDILSYPPPFAVRISLSNQFYQKNCCFCIFSTTEKVLMGISILVIPDHMLGS